MTRRGEKPAICIVCQKDIDKCRRYDRTPEMLYLRPDDTEVWLCGCDVCWVAYEDGVAA